MDFNMDSTWAVVLQPTLVWAAVSITPHEALEQQK
jgi:hypothetical protein